MPAYEFKFTEDFLVEANRRNRSVDPRLRRVKWIQYGFVICGIFAVIYGSVKQEYDDMAAGIASIIFFGGGFQIGEFFLRRNFRKSPYCNDQVSLTLDTEGLHGTGQSSSVDIKWAMVTQARRLPDGYLVSQGPHMFNWLPDSALVAGAPEDTERLLREHVTNFK